MSESPIIRLAAWLWADASSYHNKDDKDFNEALTYFYEQYRSTRIPNWTDRWVKRAQEAHEYMRREE
jgi:hypothetical protein